MDFQTFFFTRRSEMRLWSIVLFLVGLVGVSRKHRLASRHLSLCIWMS
jgi:hypothetical protein